MAKADPCSALFGSLKTSCENAFKSLQPGASGSSGSGGGLLSSLIGLNGAFDWRHFMIRVAEFGIGIVLVLVAANAGLKQAVLGNPVVKSAKQVGKKVGG
jgi:hypothetical protein